MLGKEFIRWKLLAIVEFSKKQYEIAIRARGGNKKTRKKFVRSRNISLLPF